MCRLIENEDQSEILEELDKIGFWADFISCEDSRAMIARRESVEIFVFAGDPLIKELLKPRYYSVRYWRGVDVHGAFLTHYKLIRAALMAKVRKTTETAPPQLYRWICGHGLGGAVAQLFAFDLGTRGQSAEHVVTFGQPRVGREAWSQAYNHYYRTTTRRYVNHQDPITELPEAIKGFLHSVGEQYIDSEGKISKRNTWWYRTRDQLRHEENNGTGTPPLNLEDHGITEYILKMEKTK